VVDTADVGLRDLFRRWTKGEDARALERAGRESAMTELDRDVDREDFEARKDDVAARSSWAGLDASETAADDLKSD
jgi:hypothetical protein